MNPTNDNSKFSTLIRDAMNAEKANGNRQRDLVLAMYEMEATFGLDNLRAYYKMEAKDATVWVNDTLRDMSAAYLELCETIATLRDEHSNKNTNDGDKLKYALQIEEANRRLRAAQALFKRALVAVYYLRSRKAADVKTSKQAGAISYAIVLTDDKGKPDKFPTRVVNSGNALERKGKDALDADKLKAKPKAAAAGTSNGGNPGIRGVVMATDVLGTFLAKSGNKPLEDYPDDEEKALQGLLDKLLRSKFADKNGKIDPRDVTDYLVSAKLVAEPKPKQAAA